MLRHIVALSLIMSTAAPISAFAAKCNVVGTWTDTAESAQFIMKTNKKGSTSTPNPLCNNEKSTITTTDLSKTVWDSNITSKNCTVVITADFNFDKHSCTSASGTLTIPGVGTIPDSITKTGSAKPPRHQLPARPAIADGLK
ncbi:MAG TPA: hypothetical protein VMB71_03825 [Acetobacteraceae bacterium]|nr:hypothetical protein [Acetobacteraceae bacterium]